MKVIVGILVVCLMICIYIIGIYKRQINEICRQLSFIRKYNSNMRICNDTEIKSINKLNTEINVFLDYCRESNQKAQQREETLNQTITSLAHDIRTPITSLDGYFQLLGENPDEEARKRYMACIRNRLDVTVDMLEELFTLAKLQNNMYDLVLDKICVNDLVCRAVLDFYEDFKLRGIEPHIEV